MTTAFTDQFAVALRLAIDTPLPSRGRGYWRMLVSILQEVNFLSVMQTQWKRWQQHKRFYPNNVIWWGRYVKRMVRQLFIQEGSSRPKDRQALENFYYEAIYKALQDNVEDTTFITLKRLKTKIVPLYHETQHLFL